MNAPVGYVNAGNGRQEKDPDQRVQQAIRTVFEKFLELGTARQVFLWFLEQGLEMPRMRCEEGRWRTQWRAPTYHAIVRILKHPIYAGAYAWGMTRTETVLVNGQPRRLTRLKAQDEWLVLERDHHEGYVTWDTYERIQEMIRKNIQALLPLSSGAAKRGSALLAGIIRCRRCGRKLMVRYVNGNVLRYVCRRGYQGSDEGTCINFGGDLVNEAVAKEVLRVVQPGAVEAALLASRESTEQYDQALQALQLELEARQYEADRARRQYDSVEPENRLVATELERRWNAAIEQVDALRRRIEEESHNRAMVEPRTSAAFLSLAQDIQAVWDNPRTDVRLKKRIIRTLIEEVMVDADSTQVHIVIHWKGGVHTELQVRRRRAGQTRYNTPQDIVEAVRILSQICPDERIAAWLSRNGLRTPKGHCWTRQHVTGLRSRHKIPVYEADHQAEEGWMNQSQAAAYLGIERMTLSAALKDGKMPGIHPLPIGPWLLKRDDLDGEAGRALVARVENYRKHPGRHVADNVTPDLFST